MASMRKEEVSQLKRKESLEKKIEKISQLEFMRQVVEKTVWEHSATYDPDCVMRTSLPSALPISKVHKENVRYDNGNHLIIMTEIRGVCQLESCGSKGQTRSVFRCKRCKVAIHPKCFEAYHTK